MSALDRGAALGSSVFSEAWDSIGGVVALARGVNAIPAAQLAGDLERAAAEDGLDNVYDVAVQMTMAVGALQAVLADLEAAVERLRAALLAAARGVAAGEGSSR
jgi:hypothetical protein